MPKKPASTRALEHATFSLGMITLPLSVYTGTDSSHGIKRNQFVEVPVMEDDGLTQKTVEVEREDGTKETVGVTEAHPVGHGNLDKTSNELVPTGQEVIKKIATEYGHVFVEDHEIEALFSIEPRTIVVKSIQPQSLFFQGHYVPKSLYYVEVTKTKVGNRKVPNTKAEQNFGVIMAALRFYNAMMVVEFTTRGVPKPAVLMPNGTLWGVYHTDELREQRPLPEVEVPADVAKAAFEQYLRPHWSESPLDLEDKRTALIQAFADEKAEAGDFGRSVEPELAEVEPEVGGFDLLATLAASVEKAKAEAS